jgi:hypothetical protein
VLTITRSAVRAEGLASPATSIVTGAKAFHSIEPQALSNDHVGNGRGGGSIFAAPSSESDGALVREKKRRRNGDEVAKADTWFSR